MSDLADLLTVVLAREVVAARARGMRVLAVTSPVSLVAGLAATRLGAPDLAISAGFGVLDAVDPFPAVSLGEGSYGTGAAHRSAPSDTFVTVARGLAGVCTTPAQLDAHGAANLSRVGGTDDRPGTALPGSRGIPDNNDMPGPVWYLFTGHSPRQLVAEVDFVSGPPPSPGRHRRLLTTLGLFALTPNAGWSAVSLHPGVSAEQVTEATGFAVAGTAAAPVTAAASDEERAVLKAVDPGRLRALGLVDAEEAKALMTAAVQGERGRGSGT